MVYFASPKAGASSIETSLSIVESLTPLDVWQIAHLTML